MDIEPNLPPMPAAPLSAGTAYYLVVPTVTNSTCLYSSSCYAGSQCYSHSQCAVGLCCGWIWNPSFSTTVKYLAPDYNQYVVGKDSLGRIYMSSQSAANTLNSYAYYRNRYCLSYVNGESTYTYYNSSTDIGIVIASNATSTLVLYNCSPMYLLKAEFIQVMMASILAAASLFYIV